MISAIYRYLTKKQGLPNDPPLLGPDRNPSFRESETHPLFRVYDPNGLDFTTLGYGPRAVPVQPNGPGGRNAGYGYDMPREPQAKWYRGGDGTATLAFFQRPKSGLEHL
jgi:hypothetical protein